MGGWVQVVNESSLILINGCLCCNASLCDEEVPLTCALCFFACHPVGARRPSLPRLAAHAPSPAALRHLRAHERALALSPRAGRRAARDRGDGRQGRSFRRRGPARQRVGGRVPRVARRRRQVAGPRRHAVRDGTLNDRQESRRPRRPSRPSTRPKSLPPTPRLNTLS